MNRNRNHFRPREGHIYHNHGGGTFRCMGSIMKGWGGWNAIMQNVKSGWTFNAMWIHVYEDGSIDWDFSKDGRYEEVKTNEAI